MSITKCFIIFFIGVTILIVHSGGFLLQPNTSTTANSNFVYRSELFEVQQTFEQSIRELRTEMETNLKLLASQMQNESNAPITEQRNESCVDWETKYKLIEEKYAKMESELESMKNKSIDPLTSEVDKIKNLTASLEQDLKNVFDLNNISTINHAKDTQTVASLQNNVTQLNTEVKQLAFYQQARAQDFMAFYNQTINTNKETNRKLQVVKEDLEISLNTSVGNIKEDIMKIKQEYTTVKEFDRRVDLLQTGIDISLNTSAASTEKDLTFLRHGYDELNKRVAVTVCALDGTYSSPSNVPLTNLKSIDGPIDIGALNNGIFKCPVDGLYLVSFSMVSISSTARFLIYKNDVEVVNHVVSGDSHTDSGTAVVALELSVNDAVSIRPAGNLLYFSSIGSCLTVVKIK